AARGLMRLHERRRRNALDLQLVTRSISFPDLPHSFEGYRILHLSDTRLDCLPELTEVAARLLTGIEVDLLVLIGDIHGSHSAPLALRPSRLPILSGRSASKIVVWPFSAIMIPLIWSRPWRL